jgi:hypothetical protein
MTTEQPPSFSFLDLISSPFGDILGVRIPEPTPEPSIDTLRESMEEQFIAAFPGIESVRIAAWVSDAFMKSKDDHPGFLAHASAMAELARSIRPFCIAIEPADYLEILYIAATRSDFAAELAHSGENNLPNEKEISKWVV